MLALADAIESGTVPSCSAADNIHSLALSAAAVGANATGRRIILAD